MTLVTFRSLAAVIVLSAAGACTAQTSDRPGGSSDRAGMAGQGCDAEAARWAVGGKAEEETVERARRAAGAKTVRILPPGAAATMDFNPFRLDILTDEALTVTRVRCG